ncbi:MAG: YcxB family protein [Chitinophagaceae bacterium]
MLTLKYHLTEEEYFNYNYYTAWAAPDKKGYRLRYYFRVFLMYAAIAALYIFANHSHQLVIDLVIFTAIAVAYFLMVPWLIKRSIRKRVHNILREPENHHILEEAEVILSDTGIIDKDPSSESRYDWDAIVKKADTPDCYYLYTNSHHAILIPKRTLTTPQDKRELDRLFNTWLSLSSEFAAD